MTDHEQQVRARLMQVLADADGLPGVGHALVERDYGDYADAILAEFPILAEEAEQETRYRPDRNGNEELTRTRFVTSWRPVANEGEA